jgi:hypothetical protein
MKGVLLTILFLSVSLISCREPAPVLLPSTSEQLTLSMHPNHTSGSDHLPSVSISAGSGSVTFVLTQRSTCGGRVSAGVSRAPGDLAIVVRQPPDSIVVCTPMVMVLDYAGTITGLSAGSYRVRVFEAQSNNRSRLLGSTTVSVSTPAR